MKTKLLLICFSIAVIPFLYGCKKYPYGPGFTMKPAKWRITNQWSYKVSFYRGQPPNSPYQQYGYGCFRDGIDIKNDKSYVESSTSGKWSFSSDKKSVTFTPNGSSSSDTYIIKKLTGKDLKPKELAEFGSQFAPFRTAASWYIWRSLDNQ